MEPAEILSRDENAAVGPVAKNVSEAKNGLPAIVRSPLKDVSNLSDIPSSGSSNQGDKTIVALDDSSTCGSKSETESPASSTPSRIDTTDDYESADEGPSSPTHEVDLSMLASQLETLNLGTPTLASTRPGVIFPYSPAETSLVLSSPEKDDDGLVDETTELSPISQDGNVHVNVSSPDSDEGVSSRDKQFDPVFKVPWALKRNQRPSVASSTATERSDESFYTADSTFWSSCSVLESTITKSPEEDLGKRVVKPYETTDKSYAAVLPKSHLVSSDNKNSVEACMSKNSIELMKCSPNKEDEICTVSVEVKSPVNDFIAKSDNITLREDSPLSSSIPDKSYGVDLNLSLAPARVDDEFMPKRYSAGSCKKDLLVTSEDKVIVDERNSFHEKSPEDFGYVEESPDKRRSSPNYVLGIENASTSSLNESPDFSAELEIAKEVVDSCLTEAKNKVVGGDTPVSDSAENHGGVLVIATDTEIKGNLDNVETVVDAVIEGSTVFEGALTSLSNGERRPEETEVCLSNCSPVQVDNSHIPPSLESCENSACGSEILTEANPRPSSSKVNLSLPEVTDGLSITDSNYEVSLNSDVSVSPDESTVIENECVRTPCKMSVELLIGQTANGTEVVASDSGQSDIEISSQKTELASPSELQNSIPKIIQAEQPSEGLSYPLGNSVCTNNTYLEENIIEAAERSCVTGKCAESDISRPLNSDAIEDKLTHSSGETLIIQKCEVSTESMSQLSEVPTTRDSEVHASSEPNQALVVAPITDCPKGDATASILHPTDVPHEKTDVTDLCKMQGNKTALIEVELPTENLPSLLETDALTSDCTVKESKVEGADRIIELQYQASETAGSMQPLPLSAVGIEDKLASSPDESHIIEKSKVSTESLSCLPEISSKTESKVQDVTSFESDFNPAFGNAADNTKEDVRANIPHLAEPHLSGTQSSTAAFIEAELPTGNALPSLKKGAETNSTPMDETTIRTADPPYEASEIAGSVESLSLKPVGVEDDCRSSDETHFVKNDVSTESSSQLPGISSLHISNADVVTSNKPNHEQLDHPADIAMKNTITEKSDTEKGGVTYVSEEQSGIVAPIQPEKSSDNSPSPARSEVSKYDTNDEEKIGCVGELPIQTSGIAETVKPIPFEPVAVQKPDASTEPTFKLPGIPSNPGSVEVDFGSGMSTLGVGFVGMKNGNCSSKTVHNPNEFNELIKKVDFASLAGSVTKSPIQEQDITSESITLYSSPESSADQNSSDEKVVAMDRSYKDVSKILATCSKQEQELGGSTFDFSCIQAEAAKIVSDISHANESKPFGQTNKQQMMQSSLSAETNNSEAGPVTADEDFNKEEIFHDVTTFDFDYLARAGNNQQCLSKLARQSLFVKFDPLVEKLIYEEKDSSLIAAMATHHQSSGEDEKLNITPPSHSESDERLIPITPATGKKENRQSAGGHTPSLRQEISKLQELMIQQEQAHQEKADLVEELRSRIAELEAAENHKDSSNLEKQLKLKDEELKHTLEELEKAKSSNKQLVQVMEEYEKTISQLVTVKEETKAQMEKDKEIIGAERDTALQHLSNMEVAFNDIHQKYERAKTVIETLHANEKELKKSYDAVVETVEAQNNAYLKLKQHAAEKLTAANAEIEKIHKEYNGEMARMKAVAKKNELKCKSLEESLEQKKKELLEMTQICDELIGKVTGKPYE